FDEIPIGRASIAVVHRATLRDGRTAAVKVLRPGIEDVVATDLRLMEPLLDFLSRQVGVAEAGQLVRMMDGFRQQVAEELDLRNGVFHGDVHAGNLMLLRDGRIAALDWGIVGQLDPDTHRFFRRIIEAALGDESAWDEVAARLLRVYGPALGALGLDEAEMARFVRGVMEPMLTRPF